MTVTPRGEAPRDAGAGLGCHVDDEPAADLSATPGDLGRDMPGEVDSEKRLAATGRPVDHPEVALVDHPLEDGHVEDVRGRVVDPHARESQGVGDLAPSGPRLGRLRAPGMLDGGVDVPGHGVEPGEPAGVHVVGQRVAFLDGHVAPPIGEGNVGQLEEAGA